MNQWESAADGLAGLAGSFSGLDIVEFGSDRRGGLLDVLVEKHGASRAVGLNPGIQSDFERLDGRVQLMALDAADSGLESSSFDRVVSQASFEHFHNLPEALDEAHRLLKPDGLLVSAFGPIYSGHNGHHLWTSINGNLYTYVNTPLPPWCHLYMSSAELGEFCSQELQLPSGDIPGIVDYVYSSSEQNQLSFSEYVAIVEGSKLKPLAVFGMPSFPTPEMFRHISLTETLRRIEASAWRDSDFEYASMRLLLRK